MIFSVSVRPLFVECGELSSAQSMPEIGGQHVRFLHNDVLQRTRCYQGTHCWSRIERLGVPVAHVTDVRYVAPLFKFHDFDFTPQTNASVVWSTRHLETLLEVSQSLCEHLKALNLSHFSSQTSLRFVHLVPNVRWEVPTGIVSG